MRLLGAHMSIAGGVDKAIDRGNLLGCNTIQIFVKNNNQWFGKPLAEEDINIFIAKRKDTGMFVFGHTGYLINLASVNPENYEKSLRSMREELEKSEALKLPFIVLHPGSHGGQGEEEGIRRVAQSLDQLLKDTAGYKVKIALETTAGQGNGLGYRFEHFKQWFDLVSSPERLGVCVDTCHIYAAGYDIKTAGGYKNTWSEFKTLIGFDKLLAFHLNDSKKGLNCRVDRHEHIGMGTLGKKAFKRLLKDNNFDHLPMVIETPKDQEMNMDRMNLALLHRLIG